MTVLHQTQITESKDQWAFENSEGEPFSVKDIRKQLAEQTTHQSFVQPFDWNNWATLKVSFLAWRALMGKVASKVGLTERGVSIPNIICDRCGIGREDVDHLFTSCLFARSIWWNVFAWIRVPFLLAASSLADIFDRIKHSPGSSKWRKTVHLVILATVWRIWIARNKKTFEGSFVPVSRSVEMIKEDSYLWIRHRRKSNALDWKKWIDFDIFELL
ncbi:uncharacterized protein LOC110892855 [Helianthus annuus]|uniref:uncharacterized protein LOC110892855 n=1 Tax=Helianthus annuus TaxID=4232 RepID=UPI000B8EFAE7|nr:uncharacterized protein LOC110892855 [Helianthus annuus]